MRSRQLLPPASAPTRTGLTLAQPGRTPTGLTLAGLLLAALLLAGLLPAPAAAQARTPPADARYAASTQGRVYYWIGCTSRWGRLKPANVVFFRSADEAEAAGYTPSRSAGCGRRSGDAGPGAGEPVGPRPGDAGPPRIAGTCVVQRITDGDTVVCSGERIRLLLIDAPERGQADFGLRSALALEELLPVGTTARVELDVQERDRYGRLLAHLHAPDGTHVNRALVRRGYAVVLVYPPNVRYVDRFRAAADSARAEDRGLWERGGFECLPVDYRGRRCR